MWTDPPYGIDLQVRDSSRAAFHGKKGRDWTTGVDAFKGDKLADLAPLLRAVFPNADRYLHSQHEAILYGWKTGAAHQWDRSTGDRSTNLCARALRLMPRTV